MHLAFLGGARFRIRGFGSVLVELQVQIPRVFAKLLRSLHARFLDEGVFGVLAGGDADMTGQAGHEVSDHGHMPCPDAPVGLSVGSGRQPRLQGFSVQRCARTEVLGLVHQFAGVDTRDTQEIGKGALQSVTEFCGTRLLFQCHDFAVLQGRESVDEALGADQELFLLRCGTAGGVGGQQCRDGSVDGIEQHPGGVVIGAARCAGHGPYFTWGLRQKTSAGQAH